MSAVNDGRCSPWVMCSCSVVSGNQIRDRAPPPQRAASRRFTQSIIQEGGGAEVERGEGTEGQVHVGPMRQQRREGTLGRPL